MKLLGNEHEFLLLIFDYSQAMIYGLDTGSSENAVITVFGLFPVCVET